MGAHLSVRVQLFDQIQHISTIPIYAALLAEYDLVQSVINIHCNRMFILVIQSCFKGVYHWTMPNLLGALTIKVLQVAIVTKTDKLTFYNVGIF